MNQKKLTVISLFGTMAFLSSIFALQGALLTDIINFFHPDSSAQGYSSLFSSFGGMTAFIIAFLLVGRIPKMKLLQVGILTSVVFLVCLSFSKNYMLFIAAWFLCGIGMGFIDTLLSSCIADLYTGEQATRMMCNLHTTFGISSMVFPAVYSSLKKAGASWDKIYLFVAAIGLIIGTVLFLSERRRNTGSRSVESNVRDIHNESRMTISEIFSILKQGAQPFFILAMFTHGMFLGGLNSWLTHYVSETLSGRLGSIALSFMYVGVLVSRFSFPFLKLPAGKYLPFAGLVSGAVLAAAIPFKSDITVCVAAAISALFFGAMIPCMLDTACARLKNNSLLVTTSMMLSLYLGQGLASPILGALEKTVGLQYGMYLCALFMVLTSLVNIKAAKSSH